MVRLCHGQNSSTIGVIGYRRVWEKYVMNESTGLSFVFDSMSLNCSYKFIMMNLDLG